MILPAIIQKKIIFKTLIMIAVLLLHQLTISKVTSPFRKV